MNTSRRLRTVRTVLLFLAPWTMVAQQVPFHGTADQESPRGSGKASRTIQLDVVVTAKKGSPVPGLKEQDFSLLDNKQPQTLATFQPVPGAEPAADPPVEVILLIDAVNARFQSVSFERQALDKYLRANGGQLPYPESLVFFTDSGLQMQNQPSRDGNALSAMLDQTEHTLRTINRAQGFYGAGDRLELSLRNLGQLAEYEKTRPGRKLLIWIGPGWPLLSGPEVQLTSKEAEGIFNSIVNMSATLREGRITLYSVNPLGIEEGLGRLFYYQEFLKGVTQPRQAQAGNLAIQVLATQSGGLVFDSGSDLDRQVRTCVADADAYYTISFTPPPADQPNEYHSIAVKINQPGLTARTRTGYYALP